jgi:8-oxo-dGTP pyrophosphatase MutT (NUDIX family)
MIDILSNSSLSTFPKLIKQDLDETKFKRAGLILKHDDKFLLVYGRTSKKWSFPKGKKNEKESSIDCAIREFEEETGILLTNDDIEKINFYFRTSHCVYYLLDLNYHIDIKKNTKYNYEISKVRYMTIEDIRKNQNILNYDLKTFCNFFYHSESTK